MILHFLLFMISAALWMVFCAFILALLHLLCKAVWNAPRVLCAFVVEVFTPAPKKRVYMHCAPPYQR